MTPLERLLLSRVFNSERDGQAWCFFAGNNPCTIVHATRDELMDALASSPDRASAAHRCVTERLAEVGADAAEIDLDDRFQESCHMGGIHLPFRAPI
jgi:hypothetical protein